MKIMFTRPNQLSTHLSVCHPYGMTITCVCDTQDRVVNCFPSLEKGVKGEVEGREGGGRKEKSLSMEDNITEILLATTALVAVIAFFLRYK